MFFPVVKSLAILVVATAAAAMAPPIPRVPLGHSLNTPSSTAPRIELEAYLDLVCPFSRRLYNTLVDNVVPATPALHVTLHQVPQPWHFQSCILHEALAAVQLVRPEAISSAWKLLFEHQKEYFDVAVEEMSKKQIQAKVASLLSTLDGVDEKPLLEALVLDTSGGQRNGGSASTQSIKFAAK